MTSSDLSGYYNGLYATRQRRALLDEIKADPTRYYREAGKVWDRTDGSRHTSRVDEQVAHEWLEAIPKEGHSPGWSTERTYYRLTALGEQVRMHGRETSRG